MQYVEVLVASSQYHGSEALTYSTEAPLRPGSIVSVPLRSRQALGVVIRRSKKPGFPVKPLVAHTNLNYLPAELMELMAWMKDYYASPYGVVAQQFLPKALPKKPLVPSPAGGKLSEPELPPLTTEQAGALSRISSAGAYLLHGDTGTGKTRIYIELARRSLASGASAIVLTPEIGLTSQLARDFRHVFGDKVTVLHSQLTDATRQRLWQKLLQEEAPSIVIGPRSALFSPLKKVGVIVLDEAHETAYKQDQMPYYHAARVAGKLAALHGAAFVLGSATPLVTDYFLAESKQRPVIRVQQIASSKAASGRAITVVDLKDRRHFSKSAYLSNALIQALAAALVRKEQGLLFLNRRGTARVVLCEHCGWQANCPHCDLPLVYHGDSHRMRCHTCEFSTSSPSSCPECHNASVVFKSIGTKAIVDEAARLFPDARIMRFDADNKKAERIEQNFETVRAGNVDIIVGTQALAKGLDLPHLGVVGLVLADTSLYFPDFSAQERTYQLISQVIGRVGRGHRAGEVILQTYSPDSPLLKAILANDWRTFYDAELKERRLFNFPPYCYLLKLTCRRATNRSVAQAAEKLAEQLRDSGLRIAVEGPAPAFHEKVQGKYQWQLIVKARDRGQLVQVIKQLPSGWSYDIDPMNLL